MQMILDGIMAFTNWLWGIPMLIWVVGGGIVMSVRLGFPQFTKLGFILKNTIGKSFGQKTEEGKISGFKAVTGALASTLGAGNIIGTAMAIAYGGPGGVFWLWLSGLFCSIVKYCETTMSMKYRHLNPEGEWEGGPQFYLTEGTGWKWISPVYAVICIVCLFLAASAQIGSGVDNLVGLGTPRLATTVVLTILVGIVVIGGIRSLLNVTEKLVPLMSAMYMIGCVIVILMNVQNLPAAVGSIFAGAFTGRAAIGGFAGAVVTQSIRWGVARGCFSNDAGTGVTTILHAVADVNHPIQQSMWAVFEVFFDTIVVCTMTCLVILTTGVWTEPIDAAVMTSTAFQSALGTGGGLLVTISVVLFTFTTACAQIEFIEAMFRRYVGEHAGHASRWLMLGLILGGGLIGISALISYVDFFAGLYTLVNLLGVYWCGKQIVDLTREYFADPVKWEREMWPKWEEMKNSFARTHASQNKREHRNHAAG
ncbi:MAG: amino acid carrier protein [Bacillota bacterium]|uniref:Alanine or glycine:cation symporter, AGCS family n=1 Tax=[Clostridium] aminophilum TaxID=1526 RepID=A0A1I6KA70_9FIRM|nr:amino acid carrier protein [[Clostridium] aminophilum]MDT3843680.1 amino acid carrier protein [Bacillota bacterium]SFR87938.1 alanine or glycine:cation symporter, AGCS family [[Clostridium] aminophilum]